MMSFKNFGKRKNEKIPLSAIWLVQRDDRNLGATDNSPYVPDVNELKDHKGAIGGYFKGGLSLDGDDLAVLDADISAKNDLHPGVHGHGCNIGNEGVQIGTLPFV